MIKHLDSTESTTIMDMPRATEEHEGEREISTNKLMEMKIAKPDQPLGFD
jgi:hypothetical protein